MNKKLLLQSVVSALSFLALITFICLVVMFGLTHATNITLLIVVLGMFGSMVYFDYTLKKSQLDTLDKIKKTEKK
jgi:TRAP-type C4-dicarboxylate transport system permease large subunit